MILVEASSRPSKFNSRDVKKSVIWLGNEGHVAYLSDVTESETAGLHNLLHIRVGRLRVRLWVLWFIPHHFRCKLQSRERGSATPSIKVISAELGR